MCGIAGIVSLNGDPIEKERISAMCDAIKHRGPDSEGQLIIPKNKKTGLSAGLGHRRLSIIDPSPAGNQPMWNHSKQQVLIFNGEIFNFKELRYSLAKEHSIKFDSGSDTEVLLALYEQYGISCLQMLNGMFAFGLWDEENGCFFLVRDRFGVKPLYYYLSEKELIFASEIRAILAALDKTPELDHEAIDLFLTVSYIPSPWSVYKSIRKLPSGSFLKIDNNVSQKGVMIKQWYKLQSESPENLLTPKEAKVALFDLLSDAIKLRMISDRPLGSFLSGGLDSSIITSIAKNYSQSPLQTFSVTFPNEKFFDESFYSRTVAKALGTKHHEIPLTANDVLNAIPTVLNTQDEPFADAAAIPTYLLSQFASKSIVVALSGDGADEIFGGYRKYFGAVYQLYYLSLPENIRKKFIEPAINKIPASHDSFFFDLARRGQRFIQAAERDYASRLVQLMLSFSSAEVSSFSKTNAPLGNGFNTYKDIVEKEMKLAYGEINQALYVDTNLLLADQMMVKMDRMSMQHGLEVRTPFLDYRVVELAFKIHGQDKIRRGKGKRIMLETFLQELPKELHNRPKKGFEMPLSLWFRGPLKGFVQDLLSSEVAKSQPWLDPQKIEKLFFEPHLQRKRDYTRQLWCILSLFWWLNRTSGGSKWA